MKSIFTSKIFYGGLTTIVVGFFAFRSGNYEQGITGIITGIGIIAARFFSTKRVYIKKQKGI